MRNRVVELGENYWKSKCVAGRLPARSDIDPLDIPSLLPQVVLLDVRNDPWDFRFRLIGTNVVHHLSEDWTGSWMSEIEHMAPPSRIFNSCVEVASSGVLSRSETPYVGPHHNYIRAEDVILPLATDGATPDMLLVFVEHFLKA
ncbi:MAG: PAS domain-containing protein [Alphaproteobacteria bacterium]